MDHFLKSQEQDSLNLYDQIIDLKQQIAVSSPSLPPEKLKEKLIYINIQLNKLSTYIDNFKMEILEKNKLSLNTDEIDELNQWRENQKLFKKLKPIAMVWTILNNSCDKF